MEKDAILVEMYKAHLKSKDSFTDRMFCLNRYYLVIVLLLLICGIFFIIDNNAIISLPISLVGTIISLLWWFNQDAYNVQIRVKYGEILEKMENE